MTKAKQRTPSEADRAMTDAIEAAIAGRELYPNGAMFIDAEMRGVGQAIAEAASDGRIIVLCTEAGARHVLQPSLPPASPSP